MLDKNNNPTREEVRNWFDKNRNLCRCTGYKPLVDAVMDAAKIMRGEIKAEDYSLNIPRKIRRPWSAATSFVRPRSPRLPARGISAPMLRCVCRKAPCVWL